MEDVLGFDVGSQRFVMAGEVLGSHELDSDGIGDNLVNASVGIKWNPRQHFILAANVQFPSNHDGLHSNVIPTFGVEYSL